MKDKIKKILYIVGLIVVLLMIIFSFGKINEESKETRKWIEIVDNELKIKEKETYKVEEIVSIKYPATDEMKSLGITFFNEKVDYTKIRIIEAFIKDGNKNMYVNIIAEVTDGDKAVNLKEIEGILIKNKDDGYLIVDSIIE